MSQTQMGSSRIEGYSPACVVSWYKFGVRSGIPVRLSISHHTFHSVIMHCVIGRCMGFRTYSQILGVPEMMQSHLMHFFSSIL